MKTRNRTIIIVGWVVAVCLVGMMTGSVTRAETAPSIPPYLLAQNDAPTGDSADADFDEFDDEGFDEFSEASSTAGPIRVADPLEPWNRAMFVFNDKCYYWVLKPVSKGYKAVMPTICRKGIRNFFHNVKMPVRFVNCLLQGKGTAAAGEFCRFLCNSTIGVLGFGDPASKYPELNPDAEDFGQTLGRYGLGHGIYIVWPLLGPSSLRDTVGFGGDYFLTPTTYIDPALARTGITTGEKINTTSFHISDIDAFKAGAIEPYTAERDAYLQFRKQKVEK